MIKLSDFEDKRVVEKDFYKSLKRQLDKTDIVYWRQEDSTSSGWADLALARKGEIMYAELKTMRKDWYASKLHASIRDAQRKVWELKYTKAELSCVLLVAQGSHVASCKYHFIPVSPENCLVKAKRAESMQSYMTRIECPTFASTRELAHALDGYFCES